MKCRKQRQLVCWTVLGVVFLICCESRSQISISTDEEEGSRVYLAGTIKIGDDISAVQNSLFTCAPIESFKVGDVIAAMVSGDESYSITKKFLEVGDSQYNYPVVSVLNDTAVIPGILWTKTNFVADKRIYADGFKIEAKRDIKSGAAISVLLIGSSFVSIEAVRHSTNSLEPVLIGYKYPSAQNGLADFANGGIQENDSHVQLLEAWRLENGHVGYNVGGGTRRSSLANDRPALAAKGIAPSIFARSNLDIGFFERIFKLVSVPVLLSNRDEKGKTPLHYAVQSGRIELVELLIDNKADINAKDANGQTPLHIAVKEGQTNVLELLLGKGADVNIRDETGRTPLGWASADKDKYIVNVLRIHGGSE